MTAVTFLALFTSAALAQSTQKPLRAAGRIDAVTPESITIVLPGDNKLMLAVDKTTKLTGRGLNIGNGTTAEERLAKLATLLKPADSVVVTYTDAGGGKLQASEIHVRQVAR